MIHHIKRWMEVELCNTDISVFKRQKSDIEIWGSLSANWMSQKRDYDIVPDSEIPRITFRRWGWLMAIRLEKSDNCGDIYKLPG